MDLDTVAGPWAAFVGLSGVIAVAGSRLSRYGDAIAEHTGLSGSWIGLILMATVTSLPELSTGIGSVRIAHAPDLAVGDVLGSCVFNLLLLAAVDAAHRPVCMFTQASQGHALSAGYGIVLLGLTGLGLLFPTSWPAPGVGWSTVASGFVYVLALRTIFTFERRRLIEPAEPIIARRPELTLRRALAGYAVAAAAVVAAGLALPPAADALAQAMGWTDSFVGTLFLAAATSLPEAAVTLAAVRIGALDMAIANLLGSNLFNILVLGVDDVVYPEGPLLADAAPTHLASVLAALVMTGVVVAGLIYRPKSRPAGAVSWASVALIAVYLANAWLAYAGAPPD